MRTELVTTLKRKATRVTSRLASDPGPVLIAPAGLPALLEGIARGEKAIQDRRVVSHKEAKRRLARWLA